MAPARNGIDVLLPLAIGTAMTLVTIFIHALALTTIVHFVRRERRLGYAGVHFWNDVTIVAAATSVALAAHLIEMAAWALVFVRCGEFRDFAAALYSSAENYTTLGYGDVVMSARWRLLGPLEAADGMLMFGVTTAMIFSVIQRLVQTRFGNPDG
ncbi:MAG: ion channel [Candidatus Binataceae bacterium]